VLPWANDDAYAGYWAARTRVDVFDTEGVCVYVVRQYGNAEYKSSSGITAVPKTLLPKGAGCQ
jgi:hypothetical protein